jgi:hypothetical protein
MKGAGFIHGNSPNTGAINSSGFFSLPGGNNGLNGLTGGLGNSAHYWLPLSRVSPPTPGPASTSIMLHQPPHRALS